MISDVLSETVFKLDHYLNDKCWDHVYRGNLREQIIRLRDDAQAIQVLLDTAPATDPHEAEPTGQDATLNGRESDKRTFVEWMMSEETAKRPSFFSQKDLLARGWPKRLIKRLLGDPDFKRENPHFPGTAPMLCWRQDRVLATEDTPAFLGSRRTN
jgi:hypothetical protein